MIAVDRDVWRIDDAPPTLEQAQKIVGGPVQMLFLANDDQLLVHEEGLLLGLPVNKAASRLWPQWGLLRGVVLHLTGAARWT